LKPTKQYFLKIIDEIFLNEKGSGRGIYRKEGFNNGILLTWQYF
jgi:hypothetical protein